MKLLSTMVLSIFLILLVVPLSHADAKQTKKSLSTVRAKLLKDGWAPLETYAGRPVMGKWERESLFGDAGLMYHAGYIEVEGCSGTGMNYCTFYYTRNSECLQLRTQGEFSAGEYEPTVIGHDKSCPSDEERHSHAYQ